MTRVLLIQHGETAWNRERRWQGHADLPLTPDGRRQAERLAVRLSQQRPEIGVVYASDLERAAHTGRRIAEALRCHLVLDPDWREMDVGSWSGLQRPEIEHRFPDEWRRIVAGEDLRRGGGETFAAFTSRIIAALERIAAAHPGATIAVVTHGGAIRAALLHLRGFPFSRVREIGAVANTAIAELASNGDSWMIVKQIETAAGPDVPAATLR